MTQYVHIAMCGTRLESTIVGRPTGAGSIARRDRYATPRATTAWRRKVALHRVSQGFARSGSVLVATAARWTNGFQPACWLGPFVSQRAWLGWQLDRFLDAVLAVRSTRQALAQGAAGRRCCRRAHLRLVSRRPATDRTQRRIANERCRGRDGVADSLSGRGNRCRVARRIAVRPGFTDAASRGLCPRRREGVPRCLERSRLQPDV